MYIYGKNVVKSALEKEKIEKIYLYERFDDKILLKLLNEKNIRKEFLTKIEMDHLVRGNHQGIVARIQDFEYSSLEDIEKPDSLIVILDHIEDPHNFGAIVRTCEAAGVDGIIIPKDRACEVNETVIKVSTGAIDEMKIVRVVNINTTIKDLKKRGFWIVGTDMNGQDYREIDYNGKMAIIIGNEGKGISHLTSQLCDFMAKIPMYGTTNSLNASVATGIVVFQALTKRGR